MAFGCLRIDNMHRENKHQKPLGMSNSNITFFIHLRTTIQPVKSKIEVVFKI